MAEVIRLRAGDPLPEQGDFLVITRIGRIRAFDYFIDPSSSLGSKIGERVPHEGPGYASLETALKAAQALAEKHGVEIIYVEDESVIIRPFHPGAIRPT